MSRLLGGNKAPTGLSRAQAELTEANKSQSGPKLVSPGCFKPQ